MNYAYIRVSTERQTVENQRFEITNFASSKDIQINKWIKETRLNCQHERNTLLN